MSKELILLIGAPGSGKTTDAQKIAQKHPEVTNYSTGDIIKEEIDKGTAIGNIAKSFVQKGDLVPTGMVVELIVEAVKNAPTNLVLLDGFPGKEKQLQYFCDYIFTHDSINVNSVIEVKVSEELAKKRWLASGRAEDIFEHEMASYKESLAEIESHYIDKNILKVIDGEKDLETVVNEIDEHIKSKI